MYFYFTKKKKASQKRIGQSNRNLSFRFYRHIAIPSPALPFSFLFFLSKLFILVRIYLLLAWLHCRFVPLLCLLYFSFLFYITNQLVSRYIRKRKIKHQQRRRKRKEARSKMRGPARPTRLALQLASYSCCWRCSIYKLKLTRLYLVGMEDSRYILTCICPGPRLVLADNAHTGSLYRIFPVRIPWVACWLS